MIFFVFYIKVTENISLCLFIDQMLLILQWWPEYKWCWFFFFTFLCMNRVSYNLHMVNYWLTGEFYWIVQNLVHRTTNLKHSFNANL